MRLVLVGGGLILWMMAGLLSLRVMVETVCLRASSV